MGEDRRTYPNESNPTTNQRRLTVHDAARVLGISEDAVRMRIKRGTLAADKEGGRLYVVLDIEPTTEPTHDQTAALIASLQDQVRYLREQLDAEREARTEERRRHDTLMAQLTSRIPAIEAPSEPRERPDTAAQELHQHLEEEVRETPSEEPPESPETVAEEAGRGTEPPDRQRPDTRPQERSSLWQRLFGG